MSKDAGFNSSVEDYDVQLDDAPMTQEEILMSEADILAGLLEASKSRDNPDNYRKIQIKRDGKLLFEFRIRPLSEEDQQNCARAATKYAGTKPGQPKKPIDTDRALFRSMLIYTATIDEDRAKTWDNKTLLNAHAILRAPEVIDKVLLIGEKDRIIDVIQEISGYDDNELEDNAKN